MKSRCACLVLLLMSVGCRKSGQKIDAAILHQQGGLTLQLVRYYEKVGVNYEGEVFRVHCSSPSTRSVPAQPMQPAGWVTIGNGPAIGSTSAEELARRERPRYVVFDEQTLAWWSNLALNVSFDGCMGSRKWSPVNLPQSLIDVRPKPAHCAEGADCRHYDFMGERAPQYESISVTGDTVSFIVRTPAIKSGSLRVTSTDRGATWGWFGVR
ncbi:MAG TPA: hypothetical protein VE974_26445 [Thermoanaerobaculia bacterium]|nr:hypothetical protein [Thermoanaerobaculia bacterium]